MYLKKLSLWNFRKYGTSNELPGLEVDFNKGLNVIVGENNSGKSTIIDAIKLVLGTTSYDKNLLVEDDFFLEEGKEETARKTSLEIECLFDGLLMKDNIALTGLCYFKNENEWNLKIKLIARIQKGNRVIYDIKAVNQGAEYSLSGEQKEYIKVTYLKTLRDAKRELSSGRNSRLSQILNSHPTFRDSPEDNKLFELVNNANLDVQNYFKGKDKNGSELSDTGGKDILDILNKQLSIFQGKNNVKSADIQIVKQKMKFILEKLNLVINESKTGSGMENLLFISTELLLLKNKDTEGTKLVLIEEVEAHLHVQAQIRLINFFQENIENDTDLQIILTSHSTSITSKVNLENLLICKDNKIYPMGPEFTGLEKGDYLFLERFLDSTKADLFFASGLIMVEGIAEAIVIPVIARIIGYELNDYGVSVLNVESTAFLRYARIFVRKNESIMDIPVAVVTDMDLLSDEYKTIDSSKKTRKDILIDKTEEQIINSKKVDLEVQNVKVFISPNWTFEHDIALGKLRKEMLTAIMRGLKIKYSNKIALTQEKKNEVDKDVLKFFEEAEKRAWNDDKIAFKIYKDYLLDKQASKAITAQCLADILVEKNKIGDSEIRFRILQDNKLNYIIKSIKYACKASDM